MFTGLIEDCGILIAKKVGKILIKSKLPHNEIKIGDSIAINGACLTVEKKEEDIFTFHTLDETLKRTSLELLRTGDFVNIERAMSLQNRFDGHVVTGHIDFCANILSIDKIGEDTVFEINFSSEFAGQFVEKGSISIDGISLTIAKLADSSLTVHLIPVTLEKTTLKYKKSGDLVNIETDILGKYIDRQFSLAKKTSNVTMEKLSEFGFLS